MEQKGGWPINGKPTSKSMFLLSKIYVLETVLLSEGKQSKTIQDLLNRWPSVYFNC